VTEPQPTPADAASDTRASAVTPGALLRYRVMAIITGVLLIVVFLGLLRYLGVIERTDGVEEFFGILAQVHGFVYIVYIVTVLQLWMQARWGYGRLATMALGGIVPLLSFFVERRITREVQSTLEESA
jgi:integral membrane protein